MSARARPERRYLLPRRLRLGKAYWVGARALASYGWLALGGALFGPNWRSRREHEVHRHNARRLRDLILELEGLFIKVGQLVSILTNFLPESFRHELEGLQDRVPPRPVAEIEAVVARELGRPPGAVFRRFETEAIASASLAQVHEAELEDGTRVAVKVQHPGIDRLARLDLATMRRLLAIAAFVTRLRGLDTYFTEIEAMIAEELDFEQEARNVEAIGARFANDPLVRVPRVFHDFSSRRVLVTELMVGTKISDLEGLSARGHDRRELAERLVATYCTMIFEHGLFHADPHPGNIMVGNDGSLIFLDFGAVARITPHMRSGIPALLRAILQRDSSGILDALKLLGVVVRSDAQGDRDEVAAEIVDYFQSRFLAGLTLDSFSLSDLKMDARLKLETMADLRRLDISLRDLTHVLQVPRDWILLERTLLLLLGLSSHLDPEMNPVTIVRPYVERHVLGAERDWLALLASLVKDTVVSSLSIPQSLSRVLDQASRGQLRTRNPDVRAGAELLYALGHQLLFAALSTVSAGLAYVAWDRGEVQILRAAGLGAALFGVAFLVAIHRGRRLLKRWRRRRPPR